MTGCHNEVLGGDGELRLGLADASVVVIAGASRTTRILTLDERHFRAVRPLWGKAVTLLPADQS
jgi:predicted nucleic acid-binding protein